LPQPEGPSKVNSSPSPMARSTRSTAVTAPKRFTTASMLIFTKPRSIARRALLLLQLVPLGFDLGAKLRLERFGSLSGNGLVVHVAPFLIEVGAHPARELHGHLGRRAGRALHLELGRHGEEPALHEDLLATLGQQELDERTSRFGIARPGQDGHGFR